MPQRLKKTDAFRARFMKELQSRCADRAKRVAVISPGDEEGAAEENLKLQTPSCALNRQECGVNVAQPFEMKCDVLRFVGQDARANLVENWIARPALQHPVVSRPDQLGDEQDLDLKIQAQRSSERTKEQMRPMTANHFPAKTLHQPAQKPRVLGFLGHEQFERLPIGVVGRDLARRFAEKMLPAAAFAELEMGKGTSEAGAQLAR